MFFGQRFLDKYSSLFLIFIVVLIPNIFPIHQWFSTDGYLFYTNAYDESTYLNYEISLKLNRLHRFSQHLVTGMHLLGFSGGEINFLLDIICPLLLAMFVQKIFLSLGYKKADSFLAALLFFSIPVLFGRSNSYFSQILNYLLESGAIKWIIMPEAYFPPFYRSPEPQISWVLIIVASYISIRKKTFISYYLIIPFLYVFVRIPYMFIVLTMHLVYLNNEKRFLKIRFANVAIGLFSFSVTSIVIKIYYVLFVQGSITAEFLPETRLPIFPFTGFVCLFLFLLFRNKIEKRFRLFLILVSVSPFVAANTQVVTGFIAQPNNFEQFFGTACISLVAIFILAGFKFPQWFKLGIALLGVFLMIIYSSVIFSVNSNPFILKPLPATLVQALDKESNKVIVDQGGLGSLLNMVLPRQGITGLSIDQTFPMLAEDYYQQYLCVKNKISQNFKLYPKYKKIIERIDAGYRNLNSNFIFTHINRQNIFKTFYDPNAIPSACPDGELFYVIANR